MKNVKSIEQSDLDKFHIVGNNLSLDFINTLVNANGKPLDLLENHLDLAAWAVAAKLLELPQAEKSLPNWSGGRESKSVFESALKFREVLFQMALAAKNGETVQPSVVAVINEMLKNQNSTIEVRQTDNGFEKRFHAAFDDMRELLASVAESAADLLCYANPKLIKQCEAANCVLYFYDTTKNHSRRWCSMAHCGNRAKANTFYERKKAKMKT